MFRPRSSYSSSATPSAVLAENSVDAKLCDSSGVTPRLLAAYCSYMEARALALDEGTLLEELGWVQGLARRLVADANDADDLVQEAWLKAHSTPAERFSSRPRLRAWLAAVTRRLARDTRRARGRRARREEYAAQSEVHASAADVVERSALLEAVLHAVRGLAEPYRSTVLLRFMDGFATAEVAAEMQVSEELVRKRLSRALGRLRGVLAKEWDGALPACIGDSIAAPLEESGTVVQRGGPFDSKALGAALLAGLGLVLIAQLLPPRYEAPASGGFASTAPESSSSTLTVPSSSSQDSGAVFSLDLLSEGESGASEVLVASAEVDPAPVVAVLKDLEPAAVDALAEEPLTEPTIASNEPVNPVVPAVPAVPDPVGPVALPEPALRAVTQP